MTVNEQAIEAVKQRWTWKSMHWPDLDSDQITAVLEAAMPHIRKQITEEIRAEVPVMGAQKAGKIYYLALMHAAEIVEGKE